MRTVTEVQRRLISLGYLAPGEDDGKFGHITLDAFNHYRASKGLGPVVKTSMDELNRLLFPEDEPPVVPKPKRSNPLADFFTNLLVRKGVEIITANLKGLPIMAFLSGYKTYILAALILLVAAAETFLGTDVPGFDLSLGDAFMVSLALITGRTGAKADVAKALK